MTITSEQFKAAEVSHIASLPESQRTEYLNRVELLRGLRAASELRQLVREDRMKRKVPA